MHQKSASNSAISSVDASGCGQNTTGFVTAAERHGPPRRCALRALASWVFVCWGCGGTFVTATPINAPPRPLVPRSADSVQVLASNPPLEPHVDVALLEVDQTEGLNRQGMDYMIQRLREKAAELGCDAVYVKNSGSDEGDEDSLWYDPDRAQLFASCIVFTPPCAAQPYAAQPYAAQPYAAQPCAAQPCAAQPCAPPPAQQTAGTPRIQLTPVR